MNTRNLSIRWEIIVIWMFEYNMGLEKSKTPYSNIWIAKISHKS